MEEQSKLKLRKPTEDDLRVFRESLAADEHHDKNDADWWENAPGDFMVYEIDGKRIFIKMEHVMRLHMQHEVSGTPRQIAPIIDEMLKFLKHMGKKSGFSEIIFDSVAPALIRFVTRKHYFEATKDDYHLLL